MEIVQINCAEKEILETTTKLEITLYDATYLQASKAKGYAFVTEDKGLMEKSKNVKAITVKHLLNATKQTKKPN